MCFIFWSTLKWPDSWTRLLLQVPYNWNALIYIFLLNCRGTFGSCHVCSSIGNILKNKTAITVVKGRSVTCVRPNQSCQQYSSGCTPAEEEPWVHHGSLGYWVESSQLVAGVSSPSKYLCPALLDLPSVWSSTFCTSKIWDRLCRRNGHLIIYADIICEWLVRRFFQLLLWVENSYFLLMVCVVII